MAISIPIISEFDGKGISKAVQEFKQLEGAGKKAQFAIKKAAVPAAAALGGLAVVLGDATKGAIEDAAAQKELARQLGISTGATDDQIAAVEDWIGTQGRLLGVADDELRPALASLSRVTYDVEEAQKAATLAMDIAAATGKPLETVTNALAKAYGGNTAALAKLDPSLRDMIKGGATLDEVFYALGGTFGGAAQEAANTAEGGFKRLSVSLNETKESIGAALLPIVEKALPVLQKFADWAQKNPNLFLGIAAAIGAVAVAITAVNFAMALNPFTAIAAGIALLVVGVVAAYKKFETFRNAIKSVVNGVASYFEFVANAWIKATNIIIRGINLIKPGKDIDPLGPISFGRMGGDDNAAGRGSGLAIPAMAEGGIVTSPTLALIGEAGPEAVVPLSKMGGMGGGINITVTSADPRAVVDALVRYSRQNGSLPPDVRVA
jgi:ElaB/YqjD/DUF883 family membrane-anchored ribosome-binding protein